MHPLRNFKSDDVDSKRYKPDDEKTEDNSEYLTRLYPYLGAPTVSPLIREITIPFEELDMLAIASYRAITGLLYIDNPSPHQLTEAHYTAVIRAVFKSKLDLVALNYGVRVPNILCFPYNIQLPRVIADCINAYGAFNCNNDICQLYPVPPIVVKGQPTPCFDSVIVGRFNTFVSLAENRGIIRTSRLKKDFRGTGAWMLRCSSDASCPPKLHADAETENVFISSQFIECTSKDAIIASLILNKRDCIVTPGSESFPFRFNMIPHASTFRSRAILS